MYAYHKRLDYFSTECIYSPNAYRGHARVYLKDLEVIRRSTILDIIYSGESFSGVEKGKVLDVGVCLRCGYISSNKCNSTCYLILHQDDFECMNDLMIDDELRYLEIGPRAQRVNDTFDLI